MVIDPSAPQPPDSLTFCRFCSGDCVKSNFINICCSAGRSVFLPKRKHAGHSCPVLVVRGYEGHVGIKVGLKSIYVIMLPLFRIVIVSAYLFSMV